MPEITDHQFGRMTIAGKVYTSDLLIVPSGKILDNWYRKKGHFLVYNDIDMLIKTEPDLIIIGTGVSGRMQVDPSLLSKLEHLHIDSHIHANSQAINVYNQHITTNRKIGAGFHLTC